MASGQRPGGTFALAEDLTLTRMGYGAMQLAGPHVFGPPADRVAALAVLNEAVGLGINHIDRPTTTGPISPTKSSRKLFTPTPRTFTS